jgi:hypothetical protein
MAYALAAPLAGVAAERPVDLDTITVAGHFRSVSRLTEDSHRRGIPRHLVELATRDHRR